MTDIDIPPNIQTFCEENQYEDPQRVDGQWWGTPKGLPMPVPLPITCNSLFPGGLPRLTITLEDQREVLESMSRALSDFSRAIERTLRSPELIEGVNKLSASLEEIRRACEVSEDSE